MPGVRLCVSVRDPLRHRRYRPTRRLYQAPLLLAELSHVRARARPLRSHLAAGLRGLPRARPQASEPRALDGVRPRARATQVGSIRALPQARPGRQAGAQARSGAPRAAPHRSGRGAVPRDRSALDLSRRCRARSRPRPRRPAPRVLRRLCAHGRVLPAQPQGGPHRDLLWRGDRDLAHDVRFGGVLRSRAARRLRIRARRHPPLPLPERLLDLYARARLASEERTARADHARDRPAPAQGHGQPAPAQGGDRSQVSRKDHRPRDRGVAELERGAAPPHDRDRPRRALADPKRSRGNP